MPALENPKHEAYAQLLSRGIPQRKAYVQAGYTDNKGAASRIANHPKVIDRVAEIKGEHERGIREIVRHSNIEDATRSLEEMGLTLAWCAEQFKSIYEEALKTNVLPAANTAVQNIQKLIELERQETKQDDDAPGREKISVDSMVLLAETLGRLGEPRTGEGAVDVTPNREGIPDAILALPDDEGET